MTTTDFFGPLYGVDHVPVGDEDLLFYWAIPASRDIANFIWDTDVPEVTSPWPTMEPASLRDAMVMVIGREDVTGHLYTLDQLEAYRPPTIAEQIHGAVTTQIILTPQDPCTNCGLWCEDKWCGLRGDDETMIIEGEVGE